MGHPNPLKSFPFRYIFNAEEVIWKCKSAKIHSRD